MIPIQPWYGSIFSKSSFALGFFDNNKDGTAMMLNKINVIPKVIMCFLMVNLYLLFNN